MHEKEDDFVKRVFVMTLLVLAGVSFWATGALALCVSVKEANLRSAPDGKSKKTWTVYQFMPFQKVEEKGGWIKVKDADGDMHWVAKTVVSSDYKCAVVNVAKTPIREKPAAKAKETSISPVVKNYSFKVVEVKGEWVSVADEYGNAGWIPKKSLWIQ